jgi:hypothetical protein
MQVSDTAVQTWYSCKIQTKINLWQWDICNLFEYQLHSPPPLPHKTVLHLKNFLQSKLIFNCGT